MKLLTNHRDQSNSTNNWILIFFAAAFLVRFLTILAIPTQPVSDFWSLFTRASSLYDQGTYEAIAGRPDASFPPLYPIVLTSFFWLPFDRLMIAKLINVILGSVSVLILARLARLIIADKEALLAAALLAFYPRSVLMSVLIASENLFLPLLLLWAYFIVRFASEDETAVLPLLVLGSLSGLLTLTRSVSYGLWLVYPLLSLVKSRDPNLTFKYTIVILGAHHLVLLPWAVRNYFSLGSFTFLNSTGGIGFFIGNNPGATGRFYDWQRDLIRFDPQFFSRNIIDQNRPATAIAWQWIIANPLAAAQLYFTKLFHLFSGERFTVDFAILYGPIEPPWPAEPPLPLEHALRKIGDLLVLIDNSTYLVVLFLQIKGIAQYLKMQWVIKTTIIWPAISLIASALYFPLLSAGFHAITRYRWPFTDLLMPFAALSILTVYKSFRARTLNQR